MLVKQETERICVPFFLLFVHLLFLILKCIEMVIFTAEREKLTVRALLHDFAVR